MDYFNVCHLDLEAEYITVTSDIRVVIADFSYICKSSITVRRYSVKAYNRPPETGNVNGHCPPMDSKSFDDWSFGMLCFIIMTRKFFHIKKNKRESWEKDVYLLLFKSLQHSTFSKLVNKVLPMSLSVKHVSNVGLL